MDSIARFVVHWCGHAFDLCALFPLGQDTNAGHLETTFHWSRTDHEMPLVDHISNLGCQSIVLALPWTYPSNLSLLLSLHCLQRDWVWYFVTCVGMKWSHDLDKNTIPTRLVGNIGNMKTSECYTRAFRWKYLHKWPTCEVHVLEQLDYLVPCIKVCGLIVGISNSKYKFGYWRFGLVKSCKDFSLKCQ